MLDNRECVPKLSEQAGVWIQSIVVQQTWVIESWWQGAWLLLHPAEPWLPGLFLLVVQANVLAGCLWAGVARRFF